MTTNSVAGADPKVITVTGSSPAKPATKPLVSAHIVGQSTGVGIGVPLGVATIEILGFVFRIEAVRQRGSKLQILRQESIRGNEDPAPATATEEPRAEFPDTRIPKELGDTEYLKLKKDESFLKCIPVRPRYGSEQFRDRPPSS